MIVPLPCSRMAGSTAWTVRMLPTTLVSNWLRISSSLRSSIVPSNR